jgi:hypothetical protein
MLLIRESYKLDANVGYYMYGLLIVLALTQLVILCITIREWFQISNKGIWQNIISKVIETVYFRPLRHVGEMMLKRNGVKEILNYLSKVLLTLANTQPRVLIIITLFNLYPKALLTVGLLADVFILGEIKVFYKVMWYIIVPLAFGGVIGLINMKTKRNMEELLKTQIDVKESNNTIIFTPVADKANMAQEELEKYKQEWIYLRNILHIIQSMSVLAKKRMYLTISALITLLFLVGWTACIIKVTFAYLVIWLKPFKPLILFLFYLFFP